MKKINERIAFLKDHSKILLDNYVLCDEEEERTIIAERKVMMEMEINFLKEINLDIKNTLVDFLKWMKENRHRYLLTDETRFVDEFLSKQK